MCIGGGKSSRMSFLDGLRSEWMKSGHGGSKKGGRHLYTVPYLFLLNWFLVN